LFFLAFPFERLDGEGQEETGDKTEVTLFGEDGFLHRLLLDCTGDERGVDAVDDEAREGEAGEVTELLTDCNREV